MLPALLALLLAVLLIVQFLIVAPVDLPETAFGVGRNAASLPIVARNAVADRAIAENDVFSPLRSTAGGADAVASGPLGGVVLAGSVSVGGRSYAMVIAPGGKVSRLAPGGSINGWRLLNLGASGARFGRGSERLDLPFGGSAPQAPSADEETDQ